MKPQPRVNFPFPSILCEGSQYFSVTRAAKLDPFEIARDVNAFEVREGSQENEQDPFIDLSPATCAAILMDPDRLVSSFQTSLPP